MVAGFKGNLGQHITYNAMGIPNQLTQLILYLKVCVFRLILPSMSVTDAQSSNQVEYAFEILAQLAIICSKLSLILLYRRIFVGPIFKRVTWVIGTLVLVWHGAFVFAFIFQCTPISTVWDVSNLNPTCVNRIKLWEAYAISDVLTDAMVLSMPIPAVWYLQMGTRQKWAVSGIFLLGTM